MADRMDGPRAEQIASAFVRAIAAAEAFRGATSPNPPVGCVVLDAQGRELACAAHQKAGEGHAEALALAQCRRDGTTARIHTVVVTLEPCNHTGRTPPCCDAILATPARAVWIGAADPNGQVRGGGAARLRDAGLRVESSLAGAGCAELIAPFATRMTKGRPYVTIKQALDNNGSMIPPVGQKTFTSASSLLLAHRLRKRSDAIVTGSGTVLADDPHFTVRHVPDHPGKRRGLFILDRRQRVPEHYISGSRARGFDVRVVADFAEALRLAHEAGALEVLVEAGPAVTSHILKTGPWDEHIIIRKGQGADGTDLVEHHTSQHTEEDDHVFRHR